MNTITRKIQIYVNESDKSHRSEYYKTLFTWLDICRKSANIISTHRFVQDNIKDFFYLTEEIQYKLADNSKDESGILTTSAMNSVYQILSKKYKGDIPMSTMSFLNNIVSKSYKEEKRDYYIGNRSLRSYKNNIPIPVAKKQFTNIRLDEEKEYNYKFEIYGIPFMTSFGRDKSGNAIIFRRATQTKEYKFCDSGIQYDKRKNKWFLLLTVQFESNHDKLIENKQAFAELGVDNPILLQIGKNNYQIGSKEEYLHHRLSIQRALKSRQINARYNKGGHGRKKKMQSIEYFHKKEKNYITTKLHQYSAKLIQEVYKNRCSALVLKDQKDKEVEAKENDFILRNWSYYGLKQMIEYKAKKHGINVIVL